MSCRDAHSHDRGNEEAERSAAENATQAQRSKQHHTEQRPWKQTKLPRARARVHSIECVKRNAYPKISGVGYAGTG